MTSEANGEAAVDPLLSEMRRARKGSSVLKIDLATLRSKAPSKLIFAFEGDSDKGVYYQWVRCIRPDLKYVPFPCGGKRYVLELKGVIERDKGDLSLGVYFFVDRDFDDLQGCEPHPSVFLTDYYSIENYVVNRAAIDETLTNEFNCHAFPEVRERLCLLFEDSYRKFLEATADVNERLYAARKLGRILRSHLTKKISDLGEVTLTDVTRSALPATELVDFDDSDDAAAIEELKVPFRELDPPSRYRGKFSILFMMKWLQLLAKERSDEACGLFQPVNTRAKVNHQTLTIELMASRAAPPEAFREFINAMPLSV